MTSNSPHRNRVPEMLLRRAIWSRTLEDRCDFSDWTLEIVREEDAIGRAPRNDQGDDEESEPNICDDKDAATTGPMEHSHVLETYHVHRSYLATGDRGSMYFNSLMKRASNFAETSACNSRIPLREDAANALPIVLDFMYFIDKRVRLDIANTVAVYSLADYFGIKLLRDQVIQYLQRQLSLETVHMFCKDAMLLQQRDVLRHIIAFVALNIPKMDRRSPIFEIIEPKILAHALEVYARASRRRDTTPPSYKDHISRHLSRLIASYCQRNKSALTYETYTRMTAPEILPTIAFGAAIPLYELEEALMLSEASGISKRHHHDNNSPPSNRSRVGNTKMETAASSCIDADAAVTDPTEVDGSCRLLAIEIEDADLDLSNTTTTAVAATSAAAGSRQQQSSLQQRCLSAIVDNCNKIDFANSAHCKVLQFLSARPGYVAVDVFKQLLFPLGSGDSGVLRRNGPPPFKRVRFQS